MEQRSYKGALKTKSCRLKNTCYLGLHIEVRESSRGIGNLHLRSRYYSCLLRRKIQALLKDNILASLYRMGVTLLLSCIECGVGGGTAKFCVHGLLPRRGGGLKRTQNSKYVLCILERHSGSRIFFSLLTEQVC